MASTSLEIIDFVVFGGKIYKVVFALEAMKQGGQVTLFIIVAILIVGGITTFFLLRGDISLGGNDVKNPEMAVLIEECVSINLVSGARLVGLQGGKLIVPENSIELNDSKIAYGYDRGSETLLSKSEIERQIAKYIELTLPYCFDVGEFPDFEIIKGDTTSNVDINKDSISTSTQFSISATKGDSSFTIDRSFKVEVPIRLNDMYNIAEEIIEMEIEDDSLIDLSYLAGLDYEVAVIPYDYENIIYSIADENLENPDYFYVFRFGNKLR